MKLSVAMQRRVVSRVMTGATVVAAALAVLPLFLILADLVIRGISSVNWAFLTNGPAPAGQGGGGVAHAIVGTGIIVGLGTGLGLPVGIGAGVYLAEYGHGRFGTVVRFVADVLNGTPSIVVGVFVWTLVVRPTGTFSALAGGIALAIIIVPMVTRTTEEMVRLIPNTLREAALALGYQRWRTSLTIIVRAAWPGIMTGAMVAIARITGETAPLLFTALGNLNFKVSLVQPMETLSLTVYRYATGPFPEWHRLAWGSGLVLLLLVLTFGVLARYVTRTRIPGAR